MNGYNYIAEGSYTHSKGYTPSNGMPYYVNKGYNQITNTIAGILKFVNDPTSGSYVFDNTNNSLVTTIY